MAVAIPVVSDDPPTTQPAQVRSTPADDAFTTRPDSSAVDTVTAPTARAHRPDAEDEHATRERAARRREARERRFRSPRYQLAQATIRERRAAGHATSATTAAAGHATSAAVERDVRRLRLRSNGTARQTTHHYEPPRKARLFACRFLQILGSERATTRHDGAGLLVRSTDDRSTVSGETGRWPEARRQGNITAPRRADTDQSQRSRGHRLLAITAGHT